MLAFMLGMTALVLTIDAVLYLWLNSSLSSLLGLLLLIPAALCAWGCRVLIRKKVRVLKDRSGFALLHGVDLDNADNPKKANVVLEDKALDLGFLGIGSPGSGKTVAAIGLLEYFTKQRKLGWMYWEGKGDKSIYQQLVACGAKPTYFFSSELAGSDSVNLFDGPSDSVINRLAETVISKESTYYANAQLAALRVVIPLIKALDKPASLRDLYVVLMRDEAAAYVLKQAKAKPVASDMIEAARLFFEAEAETRREQLSGLMNQLSPFVTGTMAQRLNAYRPSLNLEHAVRNGERVYFHLPYSPLTKAITVMLTEQIGVIAKNRQLYESKRRPYPQLFDDWGAFMSAHFGPITARCRSASMPISFLFQSKGQTDSVNGGLFTTEITDNIGGLLVFRVNGQETAQWAASQFGQFEARTFSVSEVSDSHRTGQSLSVQDKHRVTPDDIKNLNAGEAMISCLVSSTQGRTQSKRYRARFPLPDFAKASGIDWPQPCAGQSRPSKEQDDGKYADGLHLWQRFMANAEQNVSHNRERIIIETTKKVRRAAKHLNEHEHAV